MATCVGRAALVRASRRLSRALPSSTTGNRPDECSAAAAHYCAATRTGTRSASRGLLFSAARRAFRDLTADDGDDSLFISEDAAAAATAGGGLGLEVGVGVGEAGLEEALEETRLPIVRQQQQETRARAAPSDGRDQRRGAAVASAEDHALRSRDASGAGGGRLAGGLGRGTSHSKRMKLALFRNDVREARQVLSEAVEEGVVEGRMYYMALSIFSSFKEWSEVLAIFDELKAAGFRPGLHAYDMAIVACSNSNDAGRAVELFREMPAAGVVPEVSTYTGVMLAYGHQGRWAEAMSVFDEMIDGGVSPDEQAYRAAIEACADGGRWEKAVQLFREMPTVGFSPGASSRRAVITACKKAGHR